MSDNFLNGRVPSWLFTLPSLESLHLHNNKLTGPIEEFHQPVGPLEKILLRNNKIHVQIPNSMFELLNLLELDLSSNNLSGTVKSDMLSNLKNLSYISLSHNPLLSLITQKANFTLPSLVGVYFSSCNITQFPIFLRTQEKLLNLDLSNNRISGKISQRQLELLPNLNYFNLSDNFLTSVNCPRNFSMMKLMVLDLLSNLLQGPVTMMPDALDMRILSLSNNIFTGEISSYICKLRFIKVLDLSNNSLSGTIPKCLGNFYYLSFLNLRNNNFHGSIPQTIPIRSIQYLNLNGNKLEGSLPALVNCSYLKVLDVGNNMIKDTFPHWLATLPELQVLILRSNRFHGPIGNPKTRVLFPKLRILDLSHNQFTGFLPTRYFENFNMMRWDNHKDYLEYMGVTIEGENFINNSVQYYSIILTVKGVDREIDRILTIFMMMDLSNNQFQERIPEVIGKLNSLQVLNFSHNNLTGHIPPILENLTGLESLDLSFNSFVGEIPNQLTSLSFLSVLNLSYNRLVGSIPQGSQLNTFQNDSYIGNSRLCRLPLSNKCGDDEPPSPIPSIYHEGDDGSSWFDWKIVLMSYGCGLIEAHNHNKSEENPSKKKKLVTSRVALKSGWDVYHHALTLEVLDSNVEKIKILMKEGVVLGALVCGVLVFGCKRVFAVESAVNAGYGVIGQSILLLKNAWPKVSQVLRVFKEQGLVLAALLGLSAFCSVVETSITTL
ncbi:receptor-like protein 19 [Pistacia vera]|uniref:receptor-like protein 19 n=1 Tax=Pistacia vera TaxID=55513 RepID=UPI00126320D5|nr:receptor-like protein 19 [Pistacia vera]